MLTFAAFGAGSGIWIVRLKSPERISTWQLLPGRLWANGGPQARVMIKVILLLTP